VHSPLSCDDVSSELSLGPFYRPRPKPTHTQPNLEDAVMRQTTNFHKAELLLPNAKLHTYR